MSEKRLNIGLFVGDIADDFSRDVYKGAMIAAEEADVNLIVFPGKYFDREFQNTNDIKFEYQHNTLFTYVFPEELDLLIIAIGSIGYSSTIKRRRAFLDYFSDIPIITLASHEDGYEYVIYDNAAGVKDSVEYLIKHGRKHIGCLAGYQENEDAREREESYRQTLQEHGIPVREELIEHCNMTRWSEGPVNALLDRNPDIDAIVCVDDEVAYCVYEVLKQRNLRIGEDIAVVGFDDLSYAYKMDPPLATVRADASNLGRQAVLGGVQKLKTHQPMDHDVKVQFIPRASAGGTGQMPETMKPLFDASIERILRESRAANLISSNMFSFDKYVDQNYTKLLDGLEALGIQTCYLYLFPEATLHLPEETWVPPKEILLKACLRDGKISSIPRHSQRYPIEKLYHHRYMPRNRRYTMVLMDLFSTDTQHGLILMEVPFDKYFHMEAIAYQMGAAVRMLRLMQVQEETQKQLEESLQQLKQNNIQLDTVSKRDMLTGLLNRRGFEWKAEEVLQDNDNQGKYILTVYADMDNLKIVNDRFGHREGDFALQSIAKMLGDIFEKEDVIARIGGDEFAILAIREEPVNMKMLRQQVSDHMEMFNAACEKPYYIRMTIGGYTQSFMPDGQLAAFLDNADDDLYEAKKLRSKEIIKPDRK